MLEHIMEAEMDGSIAFSSISRMTGQGEGIYASSTSADAQQTEQIGLTLSPKITSGAKLSLDACMITDEDFQDALNQLEPLLAEAEGRTSSFRASTIHSSRHCYVSHAAKRRKISGDLIEPLFEKLSPSPTNWPKSPTVDTALPVSVNVCAETSHHDNRNQVLCFSGSELSLSTTNSSQEANRVCRENVEKAHPSTHGKIESLEETDLELAASKFRRPVPTKSCGIASVGPESAVLERDLKGEAGREENGNGPNISNEGVVNGESARTARLCHGKVLWNPDVPQQSVEEEFQGAAADCHAEKFSSRSCHVDGAAVHGVPIGFNPVADLTIAWATELAANKTTRKNDSSQNSLPPPQKSLQTSTLAPIARQFLQNLQHSLVEGYYKSLSTHQIPAELRTHFNALLKKFQSDERFQKAIEAFAMELTGAVPPCDSDHVLVPLKLRQALDLIYKKYGTEEVFRKSLDKFIIEFLKEKKSFENLSSGLMEPDDDKLGGKPKMKNLDGLSNEQLIAYCRELESSRAEYQKTLVAARDYGNRMKLKLQGKPRVGQHPAEPIPNKGIWTCFHMKFTGKDDKKGPCGRSNPYYESKLLWQEVTHCKSCKGPYDKSFEIMRQETPKKWYPQFKHKVNEAATPVACGFPGNAQVNEHRTSSITQPSPLFGASTGQMHGHPGGDEQIKAHNLSPGWRLVAEDRHYNHSSEGFQSAPLGDPSTGVNDSMTYNHSGGFRNSDIGFTDSLHQNMDLNTQDEEFDEFAINCDPLFMDEDTDLHLNQFLEETNILPENSAQFEDSSQEFAGHYPDRLNLFPQQVGPIPQGYVLPSLHQPHPGVGNSNYGPGYVSASSTIQQLGPSSEWGLNQFEQLHEPYHSPYGPIDLSTPIESAKFGNGFPAGTLQSGARPSGLVSLNSTAAVPLPMQSSLSMSHNDNAMTKAGPAIIITAADYNSGAPVVQTESLEPVPWPSRSTRVKIPKVKKAEKAETPKGPGKGWAKKPGSKPWVPPKTVRPSRSYVALAERAALRAGVSKTTVLTESQIQKVSTQNKTSARFLRKNMKSWEQPAESYPPNIMIEISEADVEVQQKAQKEKQQEAQGEIQQEGKGGEMADGGQLGVSSEDDELIAALNAEFERQDRMEALEAAVDESEVSEEE